MTLSEFKAWLDGFTEAMGDAPNAEQWAKIKAKLDTLREAAPMISYPPGKMGPYWGDYLRDDNLTQPRFLKVDPLGNPVIMAAASRSPEEANG